MARESGPVVVCVINLKGGVGKSTISALLCRWGYSRQKLNVLAIDLDHQANLSQGLMHEDYADFMRNGDGSIVELFNGYIPPSSHSSKPNPLTKASITHQVASIAGRSFDIIPSRFDFSDNLLSAVRPDQRTLARFLADNFEDKDLIIIDCAPTESVLTRAAYHASGHVLVPVRPEFFATIGFPLLNQSLNSFRRENKAHKIDVCGVVINNAFYDGGNNGGPEKTRAMSEVREESKKNSWPIYKHQMPHSRGFPKMMRGDNSYPGNATQFGYFANEFFASLGL